MTLRALSGDPISVLVLRHEEAAVAGLTATVEGVALCRLDASTAEPAKHWEGRAAALAQVRRDLRRRPRAAESVTGEDVVVRRLDEWRQQASDLSTSAVPAWTAYCAGGVAALSELLAAANTLDEAPR